MAEKLTTETFKASVELAAVLSPAQITANQNDYNPTGLAAAITLRLNTDASRTLTGLAGGTEGQVKIIRNVGSNPLVLSDADAGSTAANRFAFGASVTVPASEQVVLDYDNTTQRWVMIGFSAGVMAHVLLPAGIAAAGGAPLKFATGTLLTTPENGAVEYTSPDYFVTDGGVRYTLLKALQGSAALNFPSVGSNSSSDLTITVTGAALGDEVILGIPSASIAVSNGIIFFAFVSAADTVTVRYRNMTLSSQDPASGTFRVTVIKH